MRNERWFLMLAAPALLVAAAATAQEPPAPEPDPRPAPPPTVTPEPQTGDDEPVEEDDGTGERSYFGVLVYTGGGHDEGFQYGGPADADLDAERDAAFYVARAALTAYHRPSARTEITFAYEPELERYGEGEEAEAINHAAGLLVDHRLTRRLRWIVSGTLADGEDPSRFLDGLLVVVPRSDFRQTRVFTALERSWRKTTGAIHVGHSETEIAPVANVLEDGADRSELFGALSLKHDFNPRFAVNANLSYVEPRAPDRFLEPVDSVDPPDPDEEEDDPLAPAPDPADPVAVPGPEPLQAATLGFTARPIDGLVLLVNGGWAEFGDDSAFLAAGEIWRDAERYSLRLRYDRSIASYGTVPVGAAAAPGEPGLQSGLLGSGIAESVTLEARVRLIDRLTFRQLVRSARTELRDGQTLQNLKLTSRLVVRVADRFGLFGEFDYFDQDETEGAPRLSRQRYAVGLVIGVGGLEGPRGLLLQRERAERVLPNRGGE